MPNYAQPFGRVGEVAGGAAGAASGGGIGGFLGKVLAPLDWPRAAIWNTVRGVGRAISGEGSWDDVLGAVPGALGALGTGALAATGVGLPAAIGLGSALGGVAQGVGQATGSEAFKAADVSDLTGTEDFLPNLLAGAVTDPLTYAGGLGGASRGAKLGRQAGESVGQGLERAALQRGPNWGGGIQKMENIWEEAGLPHMVKRDLMSANPTDVRRGQTVQRHMDAMRANPALASEIAPGSTFAGSGAEAIAYKHPEYGVSKISRPSEYLNDIFPGTVNMNAAPLPRPDFADILQPSRSRASGTLRVEHEPFMQIPDASSLTEFATAAEKMQRKEHIRMAERLGQNLESQGANVRDLHIGNIGQQDPAGRFFVTDPGSVVPRVPGIDLPRASEVAQGQPGMIQNLLLKLLGSDASVRGEIAQASKTARGGSVGTALAQAKPGEIENLLRSGQLSELEKVLGSGHAQAALAEFNAAGGTSNLGKKRDSLFGSIRRL